MPTGTAFLDVSCVVGAAADGSTVSPAPLAPRWHVRRVVGGDVVLRLAPPGHLGGDAAPLAGHSATRLPSPPLSHRSPR